MCEWTVKYKFFSFLPSLNNGGKSERTCKVPAGKGLLIPVMQVEMSDKEYPGAELRN